MKRNGLGQIKNAVSIRERPPRSRSIFVILDLPGSAGQTKTPTDCCASIFRVAPICPCTARPSSVLSQGSSMKGRERPCSIRHRLRSSQNVLQRSVELAQQSGRSPKSKRPKNANKRYCSVAERTRSPQTARPGANSHALIGEHKVYASVAESLDEKVEKRTHLGRAT